MRRGGWDLLEALLPTGTVPERSRIPEALALLVARSPRRALTSAEAAARRAPSDPEAPLLSGAARLIGGDRDGARRDLERAAGLGASAAEALLAWLDAADGRRASAERRFKTLLAVKAPRRSVLSWRAAMRAEAGDFNGALADLDAAMPPTPTPLLLARRAEVLESLSRAEEAREDLADAVRLEPRSAGLRALLGKSACILRRYPEAERHLAAAARLAPGDAKVRSWRAEALLARGFAARGLAELERAARIEGDGSEPAAEYALALALSGRTREARRRLPAASRAGDEARRLFLDGVVRVKEGDFKGGADGLLGAAAASPLEHPELASKAGRYAVVARLLGRKR